MTQPHPGAPSRRAFLQAASIGAIGAAGFAVTGHGGSGRSAAAAGSMPATALVTELATTGPAARQTALTTGWTFYGREGSGNEPVTVTLPHNVTTLPWRDWDQSMWDGRWVYQRTFDLPADFDGLRVFLDFDGVLTGTEPTLNGTALPAHLGGYLPFSYEISEDVRPTDNQLDVIVDCRWLNVPPDGGPNGPDSVDYYPGGGIYRPVRLRGVPQVYLADVFARGADVLTDDRQVLVTATVDGATELPGDARVRAELLDNDEVVASATTPVQLDQPGTVEVDLTIGELGAIRLWDVDDPYRYDVLVTLLSGDTAVHQYRTTIGLREVSFTEEGCFLNGRRLKVFGLNRHQIFPYVGSAMPDRVQRRDAQILKHELNLNMVRCAHYPQSPAFLDACDELGLMVFAEPPGWQFIGDAEWQDLFVRDTRDMIRRDRNRPSIVLWGVRVNESPNNTEFYARTEAEAKRLDPSRQTTGAMVGWSYSHTDFQHEVFSYNDYVRGPGPSVLLRPPLPGKPYLVTESVGALVGAPYYRRIDPIDVQQSQAYYHAQTHNMVGADDRHCGAVPWLAFEYASGHGNIHHKIKTPGVADFFRVPKPGAAIYQAQVDPRTKPVLQPAFSWHFGDPSPNGPGAEAMICSNCDRIEVYLDGEPLDTVTPAYERFPYLRYPPTFVDLSSVSGSGPELRLVGFVGEEEVISRTFASDPSGDQLSLTADDDTLIANDANGADATRVVFRAVDQYGEPRSYAGGMVRLSLDGPADLVGENPFDWATNGGVGAVWVRTRPGETGEVRLRAEVDGMAARTVDITVEANQR